MKPAKTKTLLSLVLCAAACAACNTSTRRPTTPAADTAAFGLAPSGGESLCGQEKYARSPLPQPSGLVGDFAGVIDAESEARLTERLAALQREGEVEFAVATVETTNGVPIFDYSLATACGWGVGGKRGGLLLLVSVKDREWRIQLSRNLEKVLPDEELKEAGRRMHEPFRAGRFGEGVERAVEGVVQKLDERRARDAANRRNIPTH